jgi:hypothetical protein
MCNLYEFFPSARAEATITDSALLYGSAIANAERRFK